MVGIEFPPRVSVPICIEQGSIYHFRLEKTNSDGTIYGGDRFFIVVNVNPKTDEILILTTITSKTKNAEEYIKRVQEDKETLVRISPTDFSRLSQESVVNCNNVYPMTTDDLIVKLEQPSGTIFFEKLSKEVVDALVRGVLKSNQVSNEYKKLLV